LNEKNKNLCFELLDANIFYLQYSADANPATSQSGSLTNTGQVELIIIENDFMINFSFSDWQGIRFWK
jgi:hypothetical protein